MSPIVWSGIGVTVGVVAGRAGIAVAVVSGTRLFTGTAGMLGTMDAGGAGVAPAQALARTARMTAMLRRMSGDSSPATVRVLRAAWAN